MPLDLARSFCGTEAFKALIYTMEGGVVTE